MDGRFIFVSPSCQRITGYEAQEFMDDKDLLLRIVHPEDKPLVERHLATDLKLDTDVSEDFRIITKTGETVWIEHLSRIVVSPNGKRLGRRASNRDGTERKRMLEELSRQSAFKSGRAELFDLLRGNQQVDELCRSVITFSASIWVSKSVCSTWRMMATPTTWRPATPTPARRACPPVSNWARVWWARRPRTRKTSC